MSLVLRLPRKMHLCRSSSNAPRLPSFLEMRQNPHVLLTFDNVHKPLRLPRKTTSERPKVLRTPQFLTLLTWKWASRPQRRALFRHLNFQKWSENGVFCTFWLPNVLRAHNGVHFFDISTSKSGPTMVCFVHFDFEMCFAPTTACTFSTSQLPKVVRQWCALYMLTWKCASHHNGVQLFISHLASWLRTRRFSEPTFRPSGATNQTIGKHSVSRLSYFVGHLDLLSSETFSSLIFSLLLFSSLFFCSTSAFHLSILSEVWLLNFLRYNIFRCCYHANSGISVYSSSHAP